MLHVPEKPFEVKLFRHKFNSQEKSKYLLIKKLHRNGQISIQSFSYKLFEKHGSVDNRTNSFCCFNYTKTQSIAAVQNAFLFSAVQNDFLIGILHVKPQFYVTFKNIQMPAQVLTLIKGIQAGEEQHERRKILRQLERCSRKIHV